MCFAEASLMIISLTDSLCPFENIGNKAVLYVLFCSVWCNLNVATQYSIKIMTLTVNILAFELMHCFTEQTETLCIISIIKTFSFSAVFTS